MTAPAPSRSGNQVYRLAEVMDQLRAPGGCPWDAAQDHASLVQYLLEEAYEVAEAIEDGNTADLREELGDLLLQVVFHACIAKQAGQFDLDDVAQGIRDKLIRRHPHVFAPDADGQASLSATESHARWDRIKAAEKARTSVLDGIPRAQPVIARTQKMIGRAVRGGLDIDLATAALLPSEQGVHDLQAESDAIGGRLLEIILEAESLGLNAEAALRATARALERQIHNLENVPNPSTKKGL